MYGFASDAAGITGSLVPFTPPLPNSDPIGLAAQAAALGQSGGTAGGQQPMNFASSAGLPAGLDGETMLSMGPQLVSSIPSALQGLSSPLSSGLGSPASGLGQFQSLLSPFMSVLGNPGMLGMGTGGASAATSASGPGLAGLRRSGVGRSRGGGRGGPSRVVGRVVGTGDLDGRYRRVNQHRARGDTCGRIWWRDVAGRND